MKELLKKILKFFAQAIVKKYSPEIIGITGSVGKTTTKEAIYQVLSSNYDVRRNLKNYNNEIGVPLTVIGVTTTGGRSIFKWLGIFLKAIFLLITTDKNYPKILILEMGADHPGDIKYLTNLLPVKVGVVTAVAPAHTEFFENISQLADEKSNLVKSLPAFGTAVLNADDPRVFHMGSQTKAKVVTFGQAQGSDIYASDVWISSDINHMKGLSFKVTDQGLTETVELPNIFGRHFVTSILAAIAVGRVFDLDLITVIKSLKDFEPPKGRMKLIPGIKNTFIIDDTYNSSPKAASEALGQLASIKTDEGRKFAVLGDMLELGVETEQLHAETGKKAALAGVDYLVTVGEISRDIVRGAVASGLPEDRCFNFKSSQEAGLFLQNRIKPGDLLLVKGSQNTRMEHVVKELMANPEKASELLVRQEKPWIK